MCIFEENRIAATRRGTGEDDFAAVDHANVLAFSGPQSWRGRRVFWSGWMGETISSLDHHTWSKEAWQRLDAWCDRVAPTLAHAGATACFRPHPRHVLSDVQSCATFLKRRAGQPFEVLLDPAGLLTPSMISRAEDHILRALDALAEHPSVPAIVVANVRPAGDELFEPCRADQGLLAAALVELIRSRVPADKVAVYFPPVPPG